MGRTGRREYCFICGAQTGCGMCRVHRRYWDFEGKMLEKIIRQDHEWRKKIRE